MIYVVSDLHGCYDKYREMIEKLALKESDLLYVLGDVVDRGPDGIRILLDMNERSNVVFLRGNHDETAMKILRCLVDSAAKYDEDKLVSMLQLWVSDGGDTTLRQFMSISSKEKAKVLCYLWRSETHTEIVVDGRKYFLAHTVPEKERMLDFNACGPEDFLMGEPDYERMYFEDKYIVTGHTPTGLIEETYAGRIYQKHHHIAIDCGAVFDGGRLGCICLNTLEEFYV